ncbi:MAG: hypothetical protein IPL31_04625 [Saprospiraceae bacterium]|nr:hypothetical protein [Saprospiraceae bacterium]
MRTPEKTWQLQLFEYNLLSPDMVRATGGLSDLKILNKRTDFRTFNGTIKGQNSMVSMSIADGFLVS